MKNTKRGSIFILLAIIVAIIIGVIVYVTLHKDTKQEPQQVSVNSNTQKIAVAKDIPTWTTYENDFYGYILEYPKNWMLYDAEDSAGQDVSVYSNNDAPADKYSSITGGINIQIVPNAKNQSLQAFYQDSTSSGTWNPYILSLNHQEYKIGNYTGVKFDGVVDTLQTPNGDATTTETIIDIPVKDNIIEFKITNNPADTKTVDDILSTVSIFSTDGIPSRIYTDAKLNYQVTYSPNEIKPVKDDMGADVQSTLFWSKQLGPFYLHVWSYNNLPFDITVWIKEQHQQKRMFRNNQTVTEMSVGENNAYKIITHNDASEGYPDLQSDSEDIVIPKDNKIYNFFTSISLLPTASPYSSQVKVFEDIVSTFKFIK